MTDLEITRLCAEAMGIAGEESSGVLAAYYKEGTGLIQEIYDPLHDDAQAMELVKKFPFIIEHNGINYDVAIWDNPNAGWVEQKNNDDLNRAICECVAKMQAQKSGAGQD